MGTERTVRHLRLRAGSEAAIRRATLQLEDALRTASLPDAGGRTLLVRKLALGSLGCDDAPQTIALAIERRIAELGAHCVYAGETEAAHAPAVWFRDALDAHVQLALRVASGKTSDAWYWPLAVPGFRARTTTGEALRHIVLSLASRAEAPAALPQWAAALVAAGHAQRLINALKPADASLLARAAGLAMPRPRVGPDREEDIRSGTPSAHRSQRSLATPPANESRRHTASPDPRVELVRALLRAAGVAGDWHDPQPLPLSSMHDHMKALVKPSGDSLGETVAGVSEMLRVSGVLPTPRERPADAPSNPSAPEAVQTKPARRAREAQRIESVPLHFVGLPTQAGGLLFLLAALARIGYPQWLETQPEWAAFDIARRVLALAAERLQIDADDPVWRIVASAEPRRKHQSG